MNFTAMHYDVSYVLSKNNTYLTAYGACYSGESGDLVIQILNEVERDYPLYKYESTISETLCGTLYLTMIFSRREKSSDETNDWWED